MSIVATRPSGVNDTGLPFHQDLMRGAPAIADFMFGPTDDAKQAEANARKVYHLAEKHGFPAFKMGGALCGRKTTILAWVAAQEQAA